MEIKDFVKEIIAKYGKLQLVIAIEEMSELTKEISKDLRGKGKREHIIEEMADVQLILDELKEYYNISQEEIYKVKRKKILRTQKMYLESTIEEPKVEEKNQDVFDILEEDEDGN